MLDTLNARFAPQFRPNQRYYTTRLLDSMRAHREADGYQLQMRVVPDDSNISLAASATFEGRVIIPSTSRLWAMSGSSVEVEGFDLQLRDSATQQSLFGRRVFYQNATGQATGSDPVSGLF